MGHPHSALKAAGLARILRKMRWQVTAKLIFILSVAYSPCQAGTISVVDDGIYTSNATRLHANWTSNPAFPVTLYRYAIGTTVTDPGSGYVVGWTETSATDITINGLALQNGVSYYWYLQGKNTLDVWSETGASDGITVTTLCPTPTHAKLQPDGQLIELSGQASTDTANLPGRIYLTSPDRASGILIQTSGVALPIIQRGQTVKVWGFMTTILGERAIAQPVVQVTGAPSEIKPLVMNNNAVGGSGVAYSPGPPVSGQRGIAGGSGLNNIGLLVRTYGRITEVDPNGDFIMIDDGSLSNDGSGSLKVITYGLPVGEVDQKVIVTGISSCQSTDAGLIRVVRLRDQRDIELVDGAQRLSLADNLSLIAVTGSRNGCYRVSVPLAVPSDVVVTLTSRDPSVALLAPFNQAAAGQVSLQVVIPSGTNQSECFDFIGVAHGGEPGTESGHTVLIASAPGYTSAAAPVTVFQSTFRWNTGLTHWTLAPIQARLEIGADNLGYGFRLAQPTPVTVAGADAGIVGMSSVNLVDNTTYKDILVPTNGGGVTNVTISSTQGNIASREYAVSIVEIPLLVSNPPVTGTGVRSDPYKLMVSSPAPDDIFLTLTPSQPDDALVAEYDEGTARPVEAEISLSIPKGGVETDEFEIVGLATAAVEGDLAAELDLLAITQQSDEHHIPMSVFQTGFHFNIAQNLNQNPMPFSVSVGAMTGLTGYHYRLAEEVWVSFLSSDADVLGVPSNAYIADGDSEGASTFTINDVGTAYLIAQAAGTDIKDGRSRDITVETQIGFINPVMTSGTGVKVGGYAVQLSHATTIDRAITLTVADPGVALLAKTSNDTPTSTIIVTVAAGQSITPSFYVIGVAHNGVADSLCGTTSVNATATDLISGTAVVNVYQTRFKVFVDPNQSTMAPCPFSVFVGWGPSNYPVAQTTEVNVAGDNPLALGSTDVYIAVNAMTAEGSVATTGIGSSHLMVSTTSANIVSAESAMITVSGPTLQFGFSELKAGTAVRYNYSNVNGFYGVKVPSPAQTDIAVTITSTNPAVVLLAPAGQAAPATASIVVTIKAGSRQSGVFELIGTATAVNVGDLAGTTTLTASGSGLTPGYASVSVYQTGLYYTLTGAANYPGSASLQLGFTGIPGSQILTGAASVDMIFEFSADNPAILGPVSINMPNDTASKTSVITTSGTGSTLLTAATTNAPIKPFASTVNIVKPTLQFETATMSTGTGIRSSLNSVNVYRVKLPTTVTQLLTVTITSNDPSKATLSRYNTGDTPAVSITVDIPAGQRTSEQFEIIGVASGGAKDTLSATTTLTASAANCNNGTGTVEVYQTGFSVNASTPALVGGSTSFTVSCGTSQVVESRMARDVPVSITSSNDNVLGTTTVTLLNNGMQVAGSASATGVGQATLTANTTSLNILNGTSNAVTVNP